MKLSVTSHGAAFLWMVGLSLGPLAGSGHACLFPSGCQSWGGYGYGVGYGYGYGVPVSYSAGYGYVASYAASGYDACGLSSCYGCAVPACSGCAQGCYATYGCGVGCPPGCGATYGCCGNGLCDAGACCPSTSGSSGSGGSAAPYSAEPAPDSRSSAPGTPSNPPRTYREDLDGQNDRFKEPRVAPQKEDDSGIFPSESGGSDILLPPGERSSEPAPDSEIERGDGSPFNFEIPADQPSQTPAADEESVNESGGLEPLDFELPVAYRVDLERRRSHYRAVFKTPVVVRRDLPRGSRWAPIRDEAQLAASH